MSGGNLLGGGCGDGLGCSASHPSSLARFVLLLSRASDTLRSIEYGRLDRFFAAKRLCTRDLLHAEPGRGTTSSRIRQGRVHAVPRRKRRRTLPWWAFLWPGLPHLWLRGSLAGMTLAVAFSVLLNVLVLATLVWPAWLESRLKVACGVCVAALWVAALVDTRGELRRLADERETSETGDAPPTNENDRRLRAAQTAYLQGELTAALRGLRQAVRADRRDIECRIWYAMTLRRSGRLSSARRQLGRLERLDDAAPWRDEIDRERAAIERLEQPSAPDQHQSQTDPQTFESASAPHAGVGRRAA